MRRSTGAGAFALVFALIVGCDSSTDPDRLGWDEVSGNYTLTTLTFDPQGTLPEVDILTRLDPDQRPTLSLTEQGLAQIIYLDPATGLTRTVDGTFTTTATDVELVFGSDPNYRDFLLSQRMPFTYSAQDGSLRFQGSAPDGVRRERLVTLLPEWEDEQLFQPVPGSLHVVFTRSGMD